MLDMESQGGSHTGSLSGDETVLLLVRLRMCAYVVVFYSPHSGMVKSGRELGGLTVSMWSPRGRQSRWFSFEDSKRVEEEEKEEEQY